MSSQFCIVDKSMYIHTCVAGDFRMLVGEDKMKVHNIVQGSLAEFQKLYSPFLSNLVDFLPDDKMMKVCRSNIIIIYMPFRIL